MNVIRNIIITAAEFGAVLVMAIGAWFVIVHWSNIVAAGTLLWFVFCIVALPVSVVSFFVARWRDWMAEREQRRNLYEFERGLAREHRASNHDFRGMKGR